MPFSYASGPHSLFNMTFWGSLIVSQVTLLDGIHVIARCTSVNYPTVLAFYSVIKYDPFATLYQRKHQGNSSLWVLFSSFICVYLSLFVFIFVNLLIYFFFLRITSLVWRPSDVRISKNEKNSKDEWRAYEHL